MLEIPQTMRNGPAKVKLGRDPDDGEHWLDRLLTRFKAEGIFSLHETITVARAQALLKRNPSNRPISDSKVDEYARDMKEGRWAFNGESIIIADTGELNDGQHRCAAIVSSGTAIETVLVVGVPRARRFTTDMGMARKVGHFLGMNGVSNASNVAAIAATLMIIERFGELPNRGAGGVTQNVTTGDRPTKQQVLQYASRHAAEITRALEAIPHKGAQKVASLSRLATALILFARKSKNFDAAAKYISAIVDGDSLNKRNPIYVCRERMLGEKRGNSLTPHKTFEILIRGWNAHRAGSQMTRLSVLGNWPPISE